MSGRCWSVPQSCYVVVKLKVSSQARVVQVGRRFLGKTDLFGGLHAVRPSEALELVDAGLANCVHRRAALEWLVGRELQEAR